MAWVAVLAAQFASVNGRITKGHSGDFRHFYFASRALLAGENPYLAGTGALPERAATPPGVDRASTGGYLYPPLVAMAYAPVARLPYETAERVVLAVDLLLGAAGILLVAGVAVRRLELPRGPAVFWGTVLVGTLLDIDKVRSELQMFQTNAAMFALFALSLRWLDRRPWLAGGPLGMILNIKYLSLGLVPWLLVRRRWRTAAGTAVAAVAFALLPAVVSGWHGNSRNLRVAFGGLFRMVGVDTEPGPGTGRPTPLDVGPSLGRDGHPGGAAQANVEDITAWFSCSFTSTAARVAKFGVLPAAGAWGGLGVLLLSCVGGVVLLYRRAGVPVFAWPAASRQDRQPWRGVLDVEFAAVVMATLCFSPQTNTRHLFLALLLTIPAAGLILAARPAVLRGPVAVAAGVMFLSFVLPPGNRFTEAHHWADLWLGVGGPCWGLLVLLLTTVSAGLRDVRRAVPSDVGSDGVPLDR